MTRRHDCTLNGIIKRCGGACCSSPNFWPPKSFHKDDKNKDPDVIRSNGKGSKRVHTACGYLGPDGCTLTHQDRPITCLLYPMVLNKSDTIVGHNRMTTQRGICKGNHNRGPMLIDALKDAFVSLFGQDQYDRVRKDVLDGRDSYFDVPSEISQQFAKECEMAERNEIPPPRSEL